MSETDDIKNLTMSVVKILSKVDLVTRRKLNNIITVALNDPNQPDYAYLTYINDNAKKLTDALPKLDRDQLENISRKLISEFTIFNYYIYRLLGLHANSDLEIDELQKQHEVLSDLYEQIQESIPPVPNPSSVPNSNPPPTPPHTEHESVLPPPEFPIRRRID
jgi:hypothetical protein